MSLPERLEHAVRRAILLHQQLGEHVARQEALFDENRLDDLPGEIRTGNRIEQEIEKADETVASLLSTIESRNVIVDDSQRKYLAELLSSLMAGIQETMSDIDRTGTMLQLMKRETADEIRALDSRRRAINSYSRHAERTYQREMSYQ